jgi:hypothetical protein
MPFRLLTYPVLLNVFKSVALYLLSQIASYFLHWLVWTSNSIERSERERARGRERARCDGRSLGCVC